MAAAGPIWHDFMTQALKDAPIETFTKPDPIITDTPILNGQTQIKENSFIEIHTILYWLNKDDPQGAPPEKPDSDPQFKNWEASLQNWLKPD